MTVSVGEQLEAWRASQGREPTPTSRIFWLELGPLRVPVPHPGQLDRHDLHHLALGYAPDLVGEMEVSAFELRTGVRSPMVAVLCLAGVLLGLVVAPRRTWRAWQHARGLRNTYDPRLSVATLHAWSLDELRAWMRVTRAPR